jgi:hypothetical protein
MFTQGHRRIDSDNSGPLAADQRQTAGQQRGAVLSHGDSTNVSGRPSGFALARAAEDIRTN